MRFFLLIELFISIKFISANEYCNICRSHTMCRYEKDMIPENCTDYRKIELTTDNKTDIVDIHNNLRNFVASGGYINESDIHFPEAAAMIYLKWSDELAEIAQRWADHCRVDELQDDCRDTEEFPVGQIVVIIKLPSDAHLPPLPDIFMTRWNENFQYFSSKDVLEFKTDKFRQIGQYSQLIWDTTEYIGCGLLTFKRQDEGNKSLRIVRMVCNYGPAGNIDNSPIYKVGRACSLCSSKKCHEKYKALCVSDWKSQISLERRKLTDDIRKIMMEKYNIFRNGDECFCETKAEVDLGTIFQFPDVTIWFLLFFFFFTLFLI